MTQQTSYPDPAQLRTFAADPMPFHSVTASDLELKPYSSLTATVSDTTYEYAKDTINVEVSDSEYVPLETLPNLKLSYGDAWDDALDVCVVEDYVQVVGMLQRDGESLAYEAYWILDSICIN